MKGENMGARGGLLAFEAEVSADPDREREQGVALAQAIVGAADLAALHLAEHELSEKEFEVTSITITVAPNPGPKSYKVIITPKT